MSVISMRTDHLVRFLKTLIPTADKKAEGVLGGVYCWSTRGHWPVGEDEDDDGVGETQLLCGASSNPHVSGHTYIPSEGSLSSKGMVIPLSAAAMILGAFGPLAGADEDTGGQHITRIDVDEATGRVEVSEYDNRDGVTLLFTYDTFEEFPIDAVRRRILGEVSAAASVADGPVGIISRDSMDALIRVQRALKETEVRMLWGHRGAPVQVGIGSTWRGAVLASDSVASADPADLGAEAVFASGGGASGA